MNKQYRLNCRNKHLILLMSLKSLKGYLEETNEHLQVLANPGFVFLAKIKFQCQKNHMNGKHYYICSHNFFVTQ